MKRGNGMGSVYKLSGNRRRPWTAMITTPSGRKALGYYSTRKEASIALLEHYKDPFVVSEITFERCWELIQPTLQKMAINTQKTFKTSYNSSRGLYNKKMVELKTADLQEYLDNLNITYEPARQLRNLWVKMFDYCIQNDIVDRNYGSFVDVSAIQKGKKVSRNLYTSEEISELWTIEQEWSKLTLIQLYTGCRISELLDLRKDNIRSADFDIVKAKTESGIRTIPLCSKIKDLFFEVLGDKPFLTALDYRRYEDKLNAWSNGKHTSHDARHTIVTELHNVGVPDVNIKKLVGHKANDVTKDIYEHITTEELRSNLDLIRY